MQFNGNCKTYNLVNIKLCDLKFDTDGSMQEKENPQNVYEATRTTLNVLKQDRAPPIGV